MEIQTTQTRNELSSLPTNPIPYENPSTQESDEKARIINGFLRCLKRKDLTIRSELIDKLLKYPDVATDALVIALLSDNRHARAMAAFALAQAHHPRIVTILMNATQDECDEVRSWAIRSLGEIGNPIAENHVRRCLKDDSEIVRAEAAYSLGKLGGKSAAELLFQTVLEDPDKKVQLWAGMAFIEIDERARNALEWKNIIAADWSDILHLREQDGDATCLPHVPITYASADDRVLPISGGVVETAGSLVPIEHQPISHPLLPEIRSEPLQIVVSGSMMVSPSWYTGGQEIESIPREEYMNPEPEVSKRSPPEWRANAEPPDENERTFSDLEGRQHDPVDPGDPKDEEAGMGLSSPDEIGFFKSDAGVDLFPDKVSIGLEPEVLPPGHENTIAEVREEMEQTLCDVIEGGQGPGGSENKRPDFSPQQSVPVEKVEDTQQGLPQGWLEAARISEDPLIRCQAAVIAGGTKEVPDISTICLLMQDTDQEVRLVAKSVFAGFRETRDIEMLLEKVAGDDGSENYRTDLGTLLYDESEELRVWAVRALGMLGNEGATEELHDLLLTASRAVQREVVKSLELLGEPGCKHLIASLHHPDPVVRADILAAVHRKGPQVIPQILNTLPEMTDSEWRLCSFFLSSLGKTGLPYLCEGLETDDERTGSRIAALLGEMGYEALVPLLEKREERTGKIRRGILRALGHCRDPRTREPILHTLTDPDVEIRLEALQYARDLQTTLTPILLSWLDQDYEDIKLEAIKTLATEADPRAILPLMKRLKDSSERVRTAAIQALEEIGDRIPYQGEGWIPPQ